MKYSSKNKPLVCMQTQSTCYKGTSKMTPKGVLWHSTGANNPTLKRYVQPSDVTPAEDTYSKDKWLELLGKNAYGNDWNHIERQAGLNCWIGKLADGTITTIQTLPWDYKPWGCGSGSKGSCNSGWMQFEICEDDLTSKEYFDKVYKEACEITAYYCKMYNIDPKGTVLHNGVTVPTILCHYDSYKLGLGSNHGDVDHWFIKYGKTMDDVRNDVAKLLNETAGNSSDRISVKEYVVVTDIPTYNTASNAKAKTNVRGSYAPGTYYIYNKYPDGINGMLNISKDSSGASAGSWINPAENIASVKEELNDKKAVYDLDYPNKHLIIDTAVSNKLDKEGCTKAITAIVKNNADFDVKIAKAFFSLAPIYNIDPMRAIAQSILETGWFKFKGSIVKAEQHNYCGLGATGGDVSGATFTTIEDGVRAQLQHLYAYGCKNDLPDSESLVDPRFKYVSRGIAPYWEQLAGRWAVPGFDGNDPEAAVKAGNTYGQKIDNIYDRLSATEVTELDINKYFVNEVDSDMVTEEPDEEKIDIKKVNTLLRIIEKILTFILEFFTKKQ